MDQFSPPKRGIVYKRPVEVMEGARPAPLRLVASSIIAATLVMILFGSKALLGWANDLPIGGVSDAILDLAQDWQDWADKAGLPQFGEAIHKMLEAFRSR